MDKLKEVFAKMYPHFSAKEFECHCSDSECKKNGMEYYFLAAMEDLRLQCGFPLIINSGFRCETWNRHVGGNKFSMHLKGIAADISTQDLSPAKKHRLIRKATRFNGIGVYPNFIHLDLRDTLHVPRAFWVG